MKKRLLQFQALGSGSYLQDKKKNTHKTQTKLRMNHFFISPVLHNECLNESKLGETCVGVIYVTAELERCIVTD